VVVSQRNLKKSRGLIRGVVVNSGNANACTGPVGLRDAEKMAERAAFGVRARAQSFLVASTGVIGAPLPMATVEQGIDSAILGLNERYFDAFSRAILTTDRSPKVARRDFALSGATATLLGCTKGAGMISPNMATTLSFVVTDAPLPARDLHEALCTSCDATFNAITVDGDTSTNDMILIMASGRARSRSLGPAERKRFTACLTDVLRELATKLMREGEGVHHVVTIKVRRAKTVEAAQRVARTIANSPLVKTAIAGQDPNWGRILAAAGRAGVPIQPERLALSIGDVVVAQKGGALDNGSWEAPARKVMSQPAYELTVDLHQGRAAAEVMACDLSHEYVSINADYRS
jgi:glutamate N-acetyltransferase/amino-acid N-acetyltransferase